MKSFGLFIICSLLFLSSYAQLPPMPARPAVDTSLAPFYHGVASGDPLSDRVIIWTRVTPTAPGSISVDWQMATDTIFANIVNSGTVSTDSSLDYTVKVDVTGLSANSWYYYRFKTGTTYSITGRTKTLPTGDVDSIRLAVFSCSDFQTGYFNVYNDISKRNDISAIVHLGDYYYEYLAGGSDASGDTSRFHPLNHDACTLGDYRLWESQYKLDQDLRAMLEQYPIIQEWDDHEVADNGWYSSGLNHDPATQGSWFDRKNAAKKAYFEWNPIRPIAPGNDTIIHRNFTFGNLFNLIMIDTRLEGRDSSLGTLVSINNAYMNDVNRQMLGTTQLNWLKDQLNSADVRWKLIGSQVMVAPLRIDLLLTTYIANGDQWDGYPAERDRVLSHISQNNIKDAVFLTGDIHSSWAADLPGKDSIYVSATGEGSVATEFIGSSVTSTSGVPATQAVVMATNPWFKYVEFTKRGYLLFDINKTRVQGDFIHVSNTDTRTYTTSNDAQWMNLDNERHLREALAPLGPNPGNPPLVSPFPVGNPNHASAVAKAGLVVFSCYPNPAGKEINLQFYLDEPSKINISVADITGKVFYRERTKQLQRGLSNSTLNISDLPNGVYLVTLSSNKNTCTNRIVKSK